MEITTPVVAPPEEHKPLPELSEESFAQQQMGGESWQGPQMMG